jgi:SNF2 family DNA or RNA helicase
MSSKWLTDKGYITALITGDTDSDERDDIVEAFNEDQPLKKSTNQKPPNILISTTQTAGLGLTLTRAYRVVLMGPEWLAGTEHQCVARIRRMGQKSSQTLSYRLIAKDVKVEEGILNRQALRKEFDRMALEIQEESGEANPIELSDSDA